MQTKGGRPRFLHKKKKSQNFSYFEGHANFLCAGSWNFCTKMNSILWIFCQNVLCTAWDGFSVKSAENWEVCLKWTCTSRWIGQNHDSIETLNFVDLSKSSSHRNPNENFCMEKHLIVRVKFTFKSVAKSFWTCLSFKLFRNVKFDFDTNFNPEIFEDQHNLLTKATFECYSNDRLSK